MALLKDITCDSGLVANYIRIIAVRYHLSDDGVSCLIDYGIYANQEKRRAGMLPVEKKTLACDPSVLTMGDIDLASPKKAFYKILKSMAEMVDAIDLL